MAENHLPARHLTETTDERHQRHRGLRWFLVLAFAVSWVPLLLAHLLGYTLDQPVVQLLTMAFAPALAAIITRTWVTREGFADAGLRPRVTGAWRQYVVALAVPVLTLPTAVVLAALLGVWEPSLGPLADTELRVLVLGAPLICVLTAPIFWGEEFGWTAYLRGRLLPHRPVLSTFATGMVWGVWHWPLPFVGYFGSGRGFGWGELLGSLVMWLVLSVLLEFLLSWLWFSSGSVWPACLLHAGSNLVIASGMTLVLGEHVNVNLTTALMCLAYAPLVLWIVATGHAGRGRRAAPVEPTLTRSTPEGADERSRGEQHTNDVARLR